MESTYGVLPTRSHTWVEPSSVAYGWLAGTRQVWADGGGQESERATAWELFSTLRDAIALPSNMTARATYYRRGFAFDDGTAAVFWDGIGRAAGGVMLTVRQTAFERLGDVGSAELVGRLVPGLHVSRLDLAADADSDAQTPDALYAMLPTARSRSRAEHRVLTVDWAGGQKLTVGSRSSERYLRVYVKGAVVRHELELKQGAAGAAMERLRAGAELVTVWRDEYGRLVRWR